jgi:hypothetical protein
VVPVSSSAQLVLLPWLLGWTPARDRTTFAAGLHAGSCLGIAWALRGELRALDRRTLLLVAGASLPRGGAARWPPTPWRSGSVGRRSWRRCSRVPDWSCGRWTRALSSAR